MNCHCEAVDRHFGDKWAKWDLSRYKKKGPGTTTAALLGLLRNEGLSVPTLLDIGCGIGALSFELLKDNAERATLVDASTANLKLVEQEAESRGFHDRVTVVHGDAVEEADRIPEADLVTLDRVLCCYPDFERLIETSARKARSWVALSIPRNRWFVRMGLWFENQIRALRGNPFRTFVHNPEKIHERLVQAGFECRNREQSMVWQMSVYCRTGRTI